MTRLLRLRAGAAAQEGGTSYRCSASARWLPRILAAAALGTGFLAAGRLGLAEGLAFGDGVRYAVLGAGALLGIWVLKAGAETRLVLTVTASGLSFDYGRHSAGLAFGEIDRLDFEAPLGRARMLFPAMLLRDRDGRDWRVPVVLRSGRAALHELLERSAREDLATWAETLRLDRRMGREAYVIGAGYALAALMLVASAAFYFR